MDDQLPLPGMDAHPAQDAAATSAAAADPPAPARLRRADRLQHVIVPCDLDALLPDDHPARNIWDAVNTFDLSAFDAAIAARGSAPGRPATDPRILITLLLYAATDGVGCGREIDRLCRAHDAYRWIVGGVAMNYHTINDFRVGHGAALDGLLTDIITVLVDQELVSVRRVASDGVRIRASAGKSSFRRESTLEKLHDEVKQHIEALKRQEDADFSAKQKAKRLADAQDRAARIGAALEQLPALRAAQEASDQKAGRAGKETRVSTTDPDARVMRMADGGFRPAYNAQLSADVESRAIVAVSVTNSGVDSAQSEPARQQVEERAGRPVEEHLYDGGFVNREQIDSAEAAGVKTYAPVRKRESAKAGGGSAPAKDPHARQPGDSDLVFAWRQRMASDEAKAIYKLRASTIEPINGDLTCQRRLRQFPVRGAPKVLCVLLWYVIAYNLMHFASALLPAPVAA